MSYLVLARKYRPRNFEEMVGQEHVVQALSNALTTQRLHHAYLFTGTRGVGTPLHARMAADGPPRMVKRPTGSGGEPSSPNCVASAGGKARQPPS